MERFDSNIEFNQSQVVNMFKKLALSIPAAALLLSSSMVMADANQERINIQLKADIPTSTFHVRPPASEDFTKEQVLQWDINKKELMSWKNRLEVLNTDKGIQAKLDVPPVLIDGAKKIALTVKVNGIDVSATQPIKVVEDADANALIRWSSSLRQSSRQTITSQASTPAAYR